MKMLILALETTGPMGSAALMNEEGQVFMAVSPKTMSHLQDLLPMTKELLDGNGYRKEDLTHIAVSRGPGSFTGIRIGLATGKALAQVLGTPMVAVPTLETFAWNCGEKGALICPVFDARREQVYAGAYVMEEEGPRCLVADGAYSIEEFCALVSAAQESMAGEARGAAGPAGACGAGRALWFGDGLSAYGPAILAACPPGRQWLFADEPQRLQRADSAARCARLHILRGDVTDYRAIQPVYLRKAEAERKREEKLKEQQE